jgi:hypothetical protein
VKPRSLLLSKQVERISSVRAEYSLLLTKQFPVVADHSLFATQ